MDLCVCCCRIHVCMACIGSAYSCLMAHDDYDYYYCYYLFTVLISINFEKNKKKKQKNRARRYEFIEKKNCIHRRSSPVRCLKFCYPSPCTCFLSPFLSSSSSSSSIQAYTHTIQNVSMYFGSEIGTNFVMKMKMGKMFV